MTSLSFDDQVFNREVPFCRVYSLDSKEKLEKLFYWIFLKNRISYFIEWQDRPLLARFFGDEKQKEKSMFTIRINEADVERATELIKGLESVKLRKTKDE